jgi:hypothetical protein
MTDSKPIPSWEEAFGTPEESRLRGELLQEQQRQLLEAQKQPGYVAPGMEAWTMETMMRALRVTDPAKHQRVMQARMNHEDVDISAILRGES